VVKIKVGHYTKNSSQCNDPTKNLWVEILS
jgi:hypothetical protein